MIYINSNLTQQQPMHRLSPKPLKANISCNLTTQPSNLLKEAESWEDEYKNEMQNIQYYLLKASMKRFICHTLNERKMNDQYRAYGSISEDRLQYSVIRQWKQLTRKMNAQRAKAQFMKESLCFIGLRSIFKEWKNLLMKNRKAQKHLLGKFFKRMKMSCTCELLIRLKRIQLSSFLLSKYKPQLLQQLKLHYFEMRDLNRKALQHYNWNLKNTYFQCFASQLNIIRKENMRFRVQKMAILFHKQAIYKKCFTALTALLVNKR